jgi:glutamyl-tRNA synthetase
MKEAGIEPIALLAKLARIGTSQPVEPVASAGPLIDGFHFETFGRAPARFDMEELAALNARIVHQLPYESVAERLPEGMGPDDWTAIRPNLKAVADASDWWDILHGHIRGAAEEEDREFLDSAAEAAGMIEWSGNPWAELTRALKESTGRSGKALFLPLRRALTGRDSGPEMTALLPLIGKEETLARLRAA